MKVKLFYTNCVTLFFSFLWLWILGLISRHGEQNQRFCHLLLQDHAWDKTTRLHIQHCYLFHDQHWARLVWPTGCTNLLCLFLSPTCLRRSGVMPKMIEFSIIFLRVGKKGTGSQSSGRNCPPLVSPLLGLQIKAICNIQCDGIRKYIFLDIFSDVIRRKFETLLPFFFFFFFFWVISVSNLRLIALSSNSFFALWLMKQCAFACFLTKVCVFY